MSKTVEYSQLNAMVEALQEIVKRGCDKELLKLRVRDMFKNGFIDKATMYKMYFFADTDMLTEDLIRKNLIAADMKSKITKATLITPNGEVITKLKH